MSDPKRAKHSWAMAILALWLVLIIVAFWWFQFRNITDYDEYWASFDGKALLASKVVNDTGKPLVFHFVDPGCSCSRFSYPHIEGLEQRYASAASFSEAGTFAIEGVELPAEMMVPAGPAVAIWDQEGVLAYFGPYSGGAVCGEGADFVSSTLDQLKQGVNPQWINHEVVGCFCPWPEE